MFLKRLVQNGRWFFFVLLQGRKGNNNAIQVACWKLLQLFFLLLPTTLLCGVELFPYGDIVHNNPPSIKGVFLFSPSPFSQFHAWENFPIRAAVPPFIPPSVAATVCLFCYTVHKVVKNAPRGGGYQKRSRKMPVFKIGFRSEGSILILFPLFRVN